MTQFGDFANLNVDKLVNDARQRFARMSELQERMSAFEGHARSEDGRISATYTAAKGLTDLHLDPRALRMGSQELADTIVWVIGEAAADLQRQNTEAMSEVFGEDGNPMRYLTDRQAVEDRANEMRQSFDRTMNDVVGELDRVRKRLGF